MSDWSNQLVLEFLELYQAEPCIYDPKHPSHKNKMKVNDAWTRIKRALSVDVPVAEMKKKKESLMASFRHHLRRKKASIKSGASSDEIYKPTWYAYEVMEGFLGSLYDCDTTYNTENSAPPDEHEEDISVQEENSNSCYPPLTPMPTQQHCTPSSRLITQRQSKRPHDLQHAKQQMDQAFAILQDSCSCSYKPTPLSDERWFLFPFISSTSERPTGNTSKVTSKLPGSVVPPYNLSAVETRQLLIDCRDQNTQGIFGSFIAEDTLHSKWEKFVVNDTAKFASVKAQILDMEWWYRWKYNAHHLKGITEGIVPRTNENPDEFEMEDEKIKLKNKIYVGDVSYDPLHVSPPKPGVLVFSVDPMGLLLPICMIRMMVKLLEQCEYKVPLLTDLDWYFVPVGNPDGYYYNTVTLPNLRSMQKSVIPLKLNRRPLVKNCKSPFCEGVNIDRNFDFHWKGSQNCSDVVAEKRAMCYQAVSGMKPFSEVESKELKTFLNQKEDIIKVFIQLESVEPHDVPSIVYPWAYTKESTSNANELMVYANNAKQIIKDMTGVDYQVHQASRKTEIHGTIMDWIMGKLNGKYVFKISSRLGLTPNEELQLSSEVQCDELEYGVFGLVRQYLEEEIKRSLYDVRISEDPYFVLPDIPETEKNNSETSNVITLELAVEKYEKIAKTYENLGLNMVDTFTDILKHFSKNLKNYDENKI